MAVAIKFLIYVNDGNKLMQKQQPQEMDSYGVGENV